MAQVRQSNEEATKMKEAMRNFLLFKKEGINLIDDPTLTKEFLEIYKNLFTFHGEFDTYRKILGRIRRELNLPSYEQHASIIKNTENWRDVLEAKERDKAKIKQMLLSKYYQVPQLATSINRPVTYIEYLISELEADQYNIDYNKKKGIRIVEATQQGGLLKIDITKLKNRVHRFGFIADNHLASKFERLDVLNACYDIFEKEGITTVYNGGNFIEGEARFNKQELKVHGLYEQLQYMIKHYPQRKGIDTYYVAGDDHEGWYNQREGVNIGEYLELLARKRERNDLHYLGYMEADIRLQAEKGESILRVMHAGGGTAYAVSYTPQKMIETFQGGEKPHVLLLGHFHKAEYMFYRNVHCVQGACTQDQTTFMRKKKIRADLGAWIITVHLAEDGAVTRFIPEFLPFFDAGYYKRRKYYYADESLIRRSL